MNQKNMLHIFLMIITTVMAILNHKIDDVKELLDKVNDDQNARIIRLEDNLIQGNYGRI